MLCNTPTRSLTVGPITSQLKNSFIGKHFLIKDRTCSNNVKINNLEIQEIRGNIAKLCNVWEQRQIATFKYIDGKEFSLPKNSPDILALMSDYFSKYMLNKKSAKTSVENLLQIRSSVSVWNRDADFRKAITSCSFYEQTGIPAYAIVDIVKRPQENIFLPMYPRFEDKEICTVSGIDYEGKIHYGIIDTVTKRIMTLPCQTLELPAYKVRVGPLIKQLASDDDTNKMITVIDTISGYVDSGNDLSSLRSNIEKVEPSMQADLRRKFFDPFYRYGGL